MTQQQELSGSVLSIILVITGWFSWAARQVMVRKPENIAGMQVTAWVAVFAAPQFFIMSAIFEHGQLDAIKTAEPLVWWAVLYLGLIMTCFSYVLWNTLIRRHDVGLIAPFLLLFPVFSVIGGVSFLGEDLTFQKFYGGSVILVLVAVINFQPSLFFRVKVKPR